LKTEKLMSTEELYKLFTGNPDVCTDTRNIKKGSIFFALKGENFNGNSFAEKALENGAAYAVIDQHEFRKNDRYILTDDVLDTLQHLANYHRRQLKCPVLAITGSNGKTTTKELISRVLAKKYKVHSTHGNLNNHIGVPLTILSAPMETEMLVVEMGANHKQEIQTLCAIAMPDYGIISNVGKAHLEGFGGFEGVKKGKGEMYEFLALHHGCAFVNGNNPHLSAMIREKNVKRKIVYGTDKSFDCSGTLLETFPFLNVKWNAGDKGGTISSKLVGDYNFENILAAACIGNYFAVDPDKICQAIEEYVPDNSRSQFLKLGSNTVLLDAYNANPSSMEVALKNFSMMEGNHKLVFLGEMAELGKESEQEHKQLIDLVKSLKFEKVILVGKKFSTLIDAMPGVYFDSSADAARWTKEQQISDATILIKGSRSSKMELVLESIK
jgi:UDP-N-acetylmuramoyl-tripeptide--D-alanyl-D-alanine ligase